MRPDIDDELAQELNDAVREYVRAPPDRLTFGDRLTILLEEYDERGDRIDALEARVQKLQEQREQSGGRLGGLGGD